MRVTLKQIRPINWIGSLMNCSICDGEIDEEFDSPMGFDDQLFEPLGYGTTLSLFMVKNYICKKCASPKRL